MELSQYSYGKTLIPRATNVCGVSLRPFCMGHLTLLEETNNPLIAKDEMEVGYQEGIYRFFQALLVCALTYEEAYELLNDRDAWLTEWDRFQKNLIKNMDVESDWNIHAKLKLFKEYMAYYLDMPSYEILQEKKDAKSGTDWKAAIAIIFKKLDYSKSEIMNMPMNQLFQEWTANAEAEGSIKVFNKYTADKVKAALKKEKEKSSHATRS
jgi:hypothetical protein